MMRAFGGQVHHAQDGRAIFCYRKFMAHVAPRKRGRPPGRKVGETIGLRLPVEIEQRLDAWIGKDLVSLQLLKPLFDLA
jgi:hypothetical protein